MAAAKARLDNASGDYETMAAKADLENAQSARTLAKLVAQANAQANRQVPPGRYGPNSTDLFGGTSLTLPEDRQIHGI